MTDADPVTARAPENDPRRGAPRREAVRIRRDVVRIAGLAAVLAVVLALAAVVGFRQGWLPYAVASGAVMRTAVPSASLLAVVFGVLGLVLALVVRPREGLIGSVAAVLIGGVCFGLWSRAVSVDAKAPPVHDVSTDWTDPPMFSERVLRLRGKDANPVELAPVVAEGPQGAASGVLARPVAMVNAATCKAAAPIVLAASYGQGYDRLKAALQAENMSILTDDPQGGRLEATAARGIWALRDDLVGRVRPEGAGVRIDLRSIARSGMRDGGANCARLTRLRARLTD